VAFLGDQGIGEDARRVLRLVKDEGADMLLLLGDFDYEDDPVAWNATLDEVLGPDFPVFAVVGNHDVARWDAYQHLLEERLRRIKGARCAGEYGVNAACEYRGLFFILSGAGTLGAGHTDFIERSLASSDSIWRICAWHKNRSAMQVGGKPDDVSWQVYETCRRGGAIIATAHEHSYQRTRTLNGLRRRSIDPAWPEADSLRVGGGSTFVFVSGLGGRSIRGQARCHPSRPPYGCGFEWAAIYTATQGATYGALFLEFGVQSDPRAARGYFRNVRGERIDAFSVRAEPP